MSSTAAQILAHLRVVENERAQRAAAPGLAATVALLKAYQQRRFSHTYDDLLRSPRYGAASRFFLGELYGPSDFTHRDAQFARVVPALVRLFPDEIVDTVASLAELHALSETLDTEMGRHLRGADIVARSYIHAWQATARAEGREAQIRLTLEVAGQLDRLTRRALVRNSLRLMRGPARAAGMSELQRFLEEGFDTFRQMGGATEFVGTVDARERALAVALFAADLSESASASLTRALQCLPEDSKPADAAR